MANRRRVIETALTGGISATGPSSLYDAVLEALPGEAAVLESMTYGVRGVTPTQAARSAAAALIGLGGPMQKILNKRKWPKPWEFPITSKNRNGVIIAGVLDWRNHAARGHAWPKVNDNVGLAYQRRLWRKHAARNAEMLKQESAPEPRNVRES